MNTLPYFFCGTIGACVLVVLSLLTLLSMWLYHSRMIPLVPMMALSIITIGVTLSAFVPRIYIDETDNLYVKDTENNSFTPVQPGCYTVEEYRRCKDAIFQKITKKIKYHGKKATIEYFIPVTAPAEKKIRTYAIFYADCREYCYTFEDLENVASFHGIEGFRIIAAQ